MGDLSINNHRDFLNVLAEKVDKDKKLDAKEVREVSSHLSRLESFDRNLSKVALSEYAKQYGTAEAKTIVLGFDDDDIDTFQTALSENNDKLAGKLLRNAYNDVENPKSGELDTYNAATLSRMIRMADDDATRSFLKESGFALEGKRTMDFDVDALRYSKSDDVMALINNLNHGFFSGDWITGNEKQMMKALYKAGARLNDAKESSKFLLEARKHLPKAEFNQLLKQADANATLEYLVGTGSVDKVRDNPKSVEKVMSQLPRETREILIDNLSTPAHAISDKDREKLVNDLYLSGMKTSMYSSVDQDSARLAAKVADQLKTEGDQRPNKALLNKMVKAMDDDVAMKFLAQVGFIETDPQGNTTYHPDKIKHLDKALVESLAKNIEKGWWDASDEKAAVAALKKL